MAKKTFKIGECCMGGIITCETSKNTVVINICDFFSKNVLVKKTYVLTSWRDPIVDTNKLYFDLCDYTSSYYANKVIDWIFDKGGLVDNNGNALIKSK